MVDGRWARSDFCGGLWPERDPCLPVVVDRPVVQTSTSRTWGQAILTPRSSRAMRPLAPLDNLVWVDTPASATEPSARPNVPVEDRRETCLDTFAHPSAAIPESSVPRFAERSWRTGGHSRVRGGALCCQRRRVRGHRVVLAPGPRCAIGFLMKVADPMPSCSINAVSTVRWETSVAVLKAAIKCCRTRGAVIRPIRIPMGN